MRRFAYSMQKAKSKKEISSLGLAVVREERLKNLNAGLMQTIADSYHQERESIMMSDVNICAHLIETQKRDGVFWHEILRLTNPEMIVN